MNIIVPMAGRGSRLRPHTLTTPKPMLPVAGMPIVSRLVRDIVKLLDQPVTNIGFVLGDPIFFGDEVVDEARALPLAELRLEAVAQRLDGLAAGGEAGQVAAGALERALDEREDLGCLLARGQEALDHEVAEAREGGRARAAHQLDVLRRQLERRRLEVDVTAGRVGQQKAEVDVDDVAVGVEHDVAVVSIFHVQRVAQQRSTS